MRSQLEKWYSIDKWGNKSGPVRNGCKILLSIYHVVWFVIVVMHLLFASNFCLILSFFFSGLFFFCILLILLLFKSFIKKIDLFCSVFDCARYCQIRFVSLTIVRPGSIAAADNCPSTELTYSIVVAGVPASRWPAFWLSRFFLESFVSFVVWAEFASNLFNVYELPIDS